MIPSKCPIWESSTGVPGTARPSSRRRLQGRRYGRSQDVDLYDGILVCATSQGKGSDAPRHSSEKPIDLQDVSDMIKWTYWKPYLA